MKNRKIVVLTLFAVVLGLAPAAQASPITLKLEAYSDLGVLTNSKTIIDQVGGVTPDSNTAIDGVTTMAAFGQFNFFTSSGASVLQPGNLARLNLTAVNVSNSVSRRAGSLVLTLTNSNLDLSSAYTGQAEALSVIAGNLSGATSISIESWVNAPTLPGGGFAVFDSGPQTAGVPGLFNLGNAADPVLLDIAAGGDFSLTTRAVINFSGVGSATLTYADLKIIPVSSVPEPGSLILFGSGLLGLATVIRRKNKRSSAAF